MLILYISLKSQMCGKSPSFNRLMTPVLENIDLWIAYFIKCLQLVLLVASKDTKLYVSYIDIL